MPSHAHPRPFPNTPVTRRILRSVSPRTPRIEFRPVSPRTPRPVSPRIEFGQVSPRRIRPGSPRIEFGQVSPRRIRPVSPHTPRAPVQLRLYDGSSDNTNPLQNLRWISQQLDRLNEAIPHLSRRLVIIIRDIQGARGSEPVSAQTAAANITAMCKILRAFLSYYNHDEESPIHLAIQNNTLGDMELRDTLMVINKGIKHYSDMNQYDSTQIIPNLVASNQLPARTGGQKSKIRKHRKRAVRRLTRKLIKKSV